MLKGSGSAAGMRSVTVPPRGGRPSAASRVRAVRTIVPGRDGQPRRLRTRKQVVSPRSCVADQRGRGRRTRSVFISRQSVWARVVLAPRGLRFGLLSCRAWRHQRSGFSPTTAYMLLRVWVLLMFRPGFRSFQRVDLCAELGLVWSGLVWSGQGCSRGTWRFLG